MASYSPLRLKSSHHGRSLSLPSTSHLSTSQFDEALCIITASNSTSSSFSSLSKQVVCLKTLYCSLDNSLLLPHNQLIFSQRKRVDQVLEGHISLLDACNTTRDLFSQMKHHIQELLSALRRKDVKGVLSYLASRKELQKMIHKSLKDLKSSRNTISAAKEKESSKISVCKLKEAQPATFDLLESLLSYVMQSKRSGWSTVSDLMQIKKSSDTNEFEKVDAFLQKRGKDVLHSEGIVNHLKEMEANIQVLEQELESLSRQLIKTRVSLLNIFNY